MAAAGRIGYPVAVKVAAAGVHHKTEVGGVRLDLGSAADVERAAAALLEVGRRRDPSAAVLVERFVAGGLELIVGGRRDELFGPLVLVGLGGILAELLADVAHRLAPVTAAEAETMIGELAGRALLDGFRGRPGASVPRLAGALVAVSRLLTEHEDIVELDINPLVADPASDAGIPLALDALLVLGAGAGRRSSELRAEQARGQALASKTGADHG